MDLAIQGEAVEALDNAPISGVGLALELEKLPDSRALLHQNRSDLYGSRHGLTESLVLHVKNGRAPPLQRARSMKVQSCRRSVERSHSVCLVSSTLPDACCSSLSPVPAPQLTIRTINTELPSHSPATTGSRAWYPVWFGGRPHS